MQLRLAGTALMAVLLLFNGAGCGDTRSGGATTTAWGGSGPEPQVVPPKGRPPKTLVVKDLRPGRGRSVMLGDELVTQFVAVYVDGEPFESTWDAGRKPFRFVLGAKDASPGWERGLRGMEVGGRRELIIPPRLASRDKSFRRGGPKNTLVYVVDLLAVHDPSERSEPTVVPPAGPPPKRLVVRDLTEGTGPVAKKGDKLTVEYVGVRYDGTEFSNSWKRTKPFRFTLGVYDQFVSPGWQIGIAGMKVGGRRELIIPPRLLYENGPPSGDDSPEDSIVYVIDLVAID